MIDKNNEKSLTEKILEKTEGELKILRAMLSKAEEKNDADAAIKLAATIARIVKDAYATQMQLEQMALAMTLGRGMNSVIPGGNGGSHKRSVAPVDLKQKAAAGGITEEQLQHVGPLAVQALASIANISKNLGGNPPSQPEEPDSDPASE